MPPAATDPSICEASVFTCTSLAPAKSMIKLKFEPASAESLMEIILSASGSSISLAINHN